MALTIKISKNKRRVSVIFDASTNFSFDDIGMAEVNLSAVIIRSNAANDAIIIWDDSIKTCELIVFKDVTGGGLAWVFDHGEICCPYVDGSEVSTGVKAIFYLRR